MELGSIAIGNPSSTFERRHHVAMCQTTPPSLGFEVGRSRCAVSVALPQKGHGVKLWRRNTNQSRCVCSFAASHEESSNSPDIDIEKEKEDVKAGAHESEEAWQQTLSAFKEQAVKMQSLSKEAYETYSEKALMILKDTSEKLKIQAEKAREDLSVIAQEISGESKEYFSTASENYPEPVKDIVETFTSSPNELNDISRTRDFYVGIPYGAVLSGGGFLIFMLTGNISAIRFGVILGGAVLAMSISSLRSWRKGEKSPLLLKGQTAISTILFLRELRFLLRGPCTARLFTTLVSGAVVAFYLYRIQRDRGQSGGSSNVEVARES